MRLAKKLLMAAMVAGMLLLGTGCPADEGWQKGVADGIAGGVSSVIKTTIESLIKDIFPAA